MGASSGLGTSLAAGLLALAPAWLQDVPEDAPAPSQEWDEGDKLLGSGEVYELTLDGAWAVALERNLGLRIQELANEAARYNARASWGTFDWNFTTTAGWSDTEFESQNTFSSVAPTVEVDSQSLRFDLSKLLVSGGTLNAFWSTDNTRTTNQLSTFDTQTADVLTLSLTQPLLRGFGEDATTSVQRESEYEYQRQLEIQRAVRQALLLDVSNAYWDLVAAREQLAVAVSNLELGGEQARRERLRLDAGVGTEVDVLQADAQVALREERRIFFEFQVRQTMDRLKQLLFPGTDERLWELTLVPVTPLPTGVTGDAAPPWAQAVRVAIENRSELRQQRLVIDAAEVRHARSVSDRLSGLDLNLTARSDGFDDQPDEAFSESFSYDFPTYSATLTYNIPIGNRTARYAERSAWTAVRSARLTYDQVESDIMATVRQAVRQVVYQAEAVRAAEKSLELAQRQLQAEEARYAEDLSTTFQLLDFQQQLLDAQSQERRSRVDYARSLVALDAALGILGEVVGR